MYPQKFGLSVSFQSSGRPVIKSSWPSRPDSWRFPVPLSDPQGRKAWYGVQNLHSMVRTSLVFWFSSLWFTNLAGMGFYFMLIAPYHITEDSFVFGYRVSFSGGFQHPPLDGCWTASCSFGALAGGDECTSSIPSWMGSSLVTVFNWDCILSDISSHLVMYDFKSISFFNTASWF